MSERVSKQVFTNGEARLEIIPTPGGDVQYWIQAGINGLFLHPEEFADLFELMEALVNEFKQDS